MITLIEDSILIRNTSKGSQVKTIFNSTETDSSKYFDISKLSGKSAQVEYSYNEGSTSGKGLLNITIPESLNELAVKQYITTAIVDVLSSPPEVKNFMQLNKK